MPPGGLLWLRPTSPFRLYVLHWMQSRWQHHRYQRRYLGLRLELSGLTQPRSRRSYHPEPCRYQERRCRDYQREYPCQLRPRPMQWLCHRHRLGLMASP